MGPELDSLQPERSQTDRSLRVERTKTDRALSEKRAMLEESADELVETAREKADAVLDKARDKADTVLATAEPTVARIAVAKERKQASLILQAERAAADADLHEGREEQAAALGALLPLEREKTDRFLLTERTRSDDALAQRDDFLGMVSHDLRNLLHGIVLNATLLADKASASEEGRRTLDGAQRIQRYVARMNRLIGDLVDVVAIDAGRLSIQPEAGDAAELLTETVSAYMHASSEKQMSMHTEVIEPPLRSDFDHERMLQVLGNLLSNAIKFTPAGGAIAIRAECVESFLQLTVSDNGAGIAADRLEAVFERFWQVGKNDRRGMGLGLYISKCIVEAHGGTIWAESKPGEGSVFRLRIPRRSNART